MITPTLPQSSRQRIARAMPRLLALLITLAFINTGFAQEPGASNAAPVERYMNDSTAIVAWADISKIDLAALSDFGMKLNPIESPVKKLEPVRDALVQLGVKRIYFVGDLSVFMPGPIAFIVPVSADKAGTVRLVLGTLVGTEGTVIVDGDAVLYGDKTQIEKLQTKRDGPPDASFVKTINGLRHPHGLVIRTSASTLQPLVATLPEMFGENADVATRVGELLLKIRSVAMSGELPPSKAKLQIETDSADSAKQLAALVNEETTRRIGKAATTLQLTLEDLNVVHSTDSAEQIDAVIASLKELLTPARMRAQHMQTLNSLKQIGLAMHNFADSYDCFPPQALADEKGRRLLSWRVLILPYLDQEALYNQFHLDEPWDSEHNKTLIDKMPAVYADLTVDAKPPESGKTRMVAPLTEKSMFGRPGAGVQFKHINDGTSNTLLVVEVSLEKSVIWTKPQDVEIDLEKPLASIINEMSAGFHACLADGAARFIPKSIDPKILRALLTIDGGEIIDFDKL